jgi:hypothetical protein
MTIEQAVNAIESHLKGYMDEVPEKLLKKIHDIILSAKKVVEKEIIFQDYKDEKPDLQKEWEALCEKHGVNSTKSKKGRQLGKVMARTHFVRHIFLSYKYVTVADLGRFLNLSHATIIHARDKSKTPCIYPPFPRKGKRQFREVHSTKRPLPLSA